MKRNYLALILALVLCIPSGAASAAGLSTATAAAYAVVFNEQLQQNGIANGFGESGLQYASVEDLDGDGSPELLVLCYEDSQVLNVGIWTMKNGSAVRTVDHDIVSQPRWEIQLSLASENGRRPLCWIIPSPSGIYGELIYADGTVREGSADYNGAAEGQTVNPWGEGVDLGTPFLYGGGTTWSYDEALTDTVALLSLTLAQVGMPDNTATASQYGTYTINGRVGTEAYRITFEQARVEEKTVLVRQAWEDYDTPEGQLDYSDYAEERVTLITLRSGSDISVIYGFPYATAGSDLGGGRYQERLSGSYDSFRSGPAEQTFTGPDYSLFIPAGEIDLHENRCFVVLEADGGVGGFSDVKAGDYCADAVVWAVNQGITSGTGPATFSPEATCTTAEILTFLWRADGLPTVSGANPFSDLTQGDFAYHAAVWAGAQGLVSGSGLQAKVPCTRADVVTYLWKLAGQPAAGGASFADVPAGAPYAQAVAWAVEAGITTGTGGGAFSPDATCTRGQIVTFLYRDMAR